MMRTDRLGFRLVLNCLGLALCIIPPALAIFLYFPVWVAKGGEYILSGVAVLLMIVAFVPLFKLVKRLLRSPSGYAIWLAIFLLFFFVSRIAEEMIVISFVGFISNIAGAVLFRIARGGGDGR